MYMYIAHGSDTLRLQQNETNEMCQSVLFAKEQSSTRVKDVQQTYHLRF